MDYLKDFNIFTEYIEAKDFIQSLDGKYYTYLLIDSTTDSPFYIGKGRGGRLWYHFQTNRGRVAEYIERLRDSSYPILVGIREASSEQVALDVEAILIRKYRKHVVNVLDKGSISRDLKYTTKSYIKAVKEVWGEDIDCSLIEYKGANYPVYPICALHPDVKPKGIRAHRLLEGMEPCPICQKDNLKESCSKRTNDNLKMSEEEALNRLIDVVDFPIDIEGAVYQGSSYPITVGCREPGHGRFETPTYWKLYTGHNGCPVCRARKFNFEKAEQIREMMKSNSANKVRICFNTSRQSVLKVCNFEGAYRVDYVYSRYKGESENG